MDLVASAENIIVAMMHTNRAGDSKLLKKCSLPLTGVNCVKKIVSNLAVLEIVNNSFKLLERAPGVSIEEIKNGCFASSKYESKMVIMNSPHILCFANELPDTQKLSRDRWNLHDLNPEVENPE